MVINEVLVVAYIYLICSAILTIVALIGNIWTCYIFTRKKFRKVSMFFYLAITNILNLLMMLTVWPNSLATNAFKTKTLSFSCKFFTFLSFYLSDLGPCVLLLSSLDRLASVKYSQKFQFRNKLKYQILIVLVISLAVAGLNLPVVMYMDLVALKYNNVTYIVCTFDLYDFVPISKYILVKSSFVSLFIPFFLMLLSTILIAHHLVKHKRKFNSSRTKFKKEVRYVRVVISVDFFYFITNSPTLCKGLIYVFTNNYDDNIWLMAFLNILLEIYLSADFFLYYWCNKLFRDHVKIIFHCMKQRKFKVSSVNKHT
jgi:hypothetical protein